MQDELPLQELKELAVQLTGHFGLQDMQLSEECWTGSLNAVFRGHSPAGDFAIRLRVGSGFRYEPVIKEAFLFALLAHQRDFVSCRAKFQELLSAQQGHLIYPQTFTFPEVYSSWRAEFPYPGAVTAWLNGETFDCTKHSQYDQAGGLLARIHRVTLDDFYSDIFAFADNSPISHEELLREQLDHERTEARGYLPKELNDTLLAYTLPKAKSLQPVLVHNDFSIRNIIATPSSGLRAIDWDNWKIDCRELDLVKMYYWTVEENGKLSPCPERFRIFRESYERHAQRKIDQELFRAYRIIWLLRVMNFEFGREGEEGISSFTPLLREALQLS